MTFTYTPDDDLRVHEEGAIKLLCQAFRSHENGIPEWAKNAADAYVRDGAVPERRIVVLLFQDARRNDPAIIACLDFVGISAQDIETYFRHWADPDAAGHGAHEADIQGGHGNGGKCYMTQMFDDYACLHTVRDDRYNCYGVEAGSVRFGYTPDRQHGRAQPITNKQEKLAEVLNAFGITPQHLPDAAAQSLKQGKGWTLVLGRRPRDCGSRIPTHQLLESMLGHHQMIRTLQLCTVFAVVNGNPYNGGTALALPEIRPLAGAEEPRVIDIPQVLRDPRSEENVSTTVDDTHQQGSLELRTSDVSMRWKRKWRHNIVYQTYTGFIGLTDMGELLRSYYGDRIYGTCKLDALDQYKQNDRTHLSDSPLTRAVKEWIREKVEQYAKEFEAQEERTRDQEERSELSRMNAALDEWKNQFLEEMVQGIWGPGTGIGPTPPTRERFPAGTPTEIRIRIVYGYSGVGVTIKPSIKFFDKDGRRIRAVPYHWVGSDNNIAMMDKELLTINTFSDGLFEVFAETLDRRVRSNIVKLKVLHLHEITISPPEVTLSVGHRQSFRATCRLANGDRTSDVYLIWAEDNPQVARVSAAGVVYGFQVGETQIHAMDERCACTAPARVIVEPATERGKNGERGPAYPRILLSEIDPDPDTGEPPSLSPREPPVHQRVEDVDRNIWWINMACPLAQRYLNAARGYGFREREWRAYHLERYIEAMVKIVLTIEAQKEEEFTFESWMRRWDEMAPLMQERAASSLSEFLDEGTFPEV